MSYLKDLDDAGELKLRTYQMVMVKGDDFSADKAVEYALALRESYDSDTLRLHGIKVHPEGVHTSHASVMLAPWQDKPDLVAVRGVSAERTEEVVMTANAAELDMAVHVDGSKTGRETIDSYIRAKEAGYTDARNSIEHFAFVHPDDIQRTIDNDILVNITPIWATPWGGGLDAALEIMGEERTLTHFQQIRTLMDGGAPVSIGADVPSTNAQLMAALTRRDPSNPEDERVFPPMSQALTLDQCLYAATMGGAYQARVEDRIGSIEVGKYADLVVLGEDIVAVAPDRIAETPILATVMNGRFTHRDGI